MKIDSCSQHFKKKFTHWRDLHGLLWRRMWKVYYYSFTSNFNRNFKPLKCNKNPDKRAGWRKSPSVTPHNRQTKMEKTHTKRALWSLWTFWFVSCHNNFKQPHVLRDVLMKIYFRGPHLFKVVLLAEDPCMGCCDDACREHQLFSTLSCLCCTKENNNKLLID